MKTKQHRWWRKKKHFKTNVKKFNKRYCLAKTSWASKLLNLKKVWILFESVSSWFARRIYLLRTPIAMIWFSCSSLHMIVVVCWFCFVYFPFAPEIFFSSSVFCRYLKHVLFDIWSGRTLIDKTQMQLGIKVSRGDTVVKSSFNSQTVRSFNRQLILISIICVEREALSLRLKQLTCIPTEYWSKTTQYVLINFWPVLKFNIFYLKYSISVLVDFSRLSDINIFFASTIFRWSFHKIEIKFLASGHLFSPNVRSHRVI